MKKPSRMALLDASRPRALIIEKPLCGPDLAGCAALWDRVKKEGIFAGVGYNHTLGKNTVLAEEILRSGITGPVSTISARTREHRSKLDHRQGTAEGVNPSCDPDRND